MLRLVALVALFAGFCWFGTHVQLGSQTLFGHLHSIAGTRESQDLFDGTRASARPLVDDVRRRIAGVPASAKPEPTTPVREAESAPESKKADSKADPKTDSKTDSTKSESTKDELARANHRGPDNGAPEEKLTAAERRHLRRLISSAEGASARR